MQFQLGNKHPHNLVLQRSTFLFGNAADVLVHVRNVLQGTLGIVVAL